VQNGKGAIVPVGCLPLLILAGLLVLFPLFLANAIVTALAKLGLSPSMSIVVAISIFAGGLINIPVRRIPRDVLVETYPFGLFGLGRFFPRMMRRRTYTVIAVNLGGCVIPCMLVVYELIRLAGSGSAAILTTAVAASINVAVCYRLARPVPNVGIALPALVPALVAAACGLLLLNEHAPLVAFTAGVLGPLVGADLMHLRDIEELSTGVASIGGAGTFDGIVLSGLIATLLA
jgi:uncharacterized membrane protein